MITKTILSFVLGIFGTIFSAVNLPLLPTEIINNAKSYLSTIMQNLSLIQLTIRPTTLKAVCGILVTLTIFKFAFPKLRYLYSKLPFVKK